MKIKLPVSVWLAPGARVTVSAKARPSPLTLEPREILAALDAGEVKVDGASVDALGLREISALAIVLAQAGVGREEEVAVACQNCDTVFHARPALEVELGPFLDGELDDEELDPPFDEGPHDVTGTGERETSRVRFVRRAGKALREALALDGDDADRLVALGVAALDDATDPTRIAEQLRENPDTFDDVEDLLAAQLSPLRLEAGSICPECGLRSYLPAPRRQALPWEPLPPMTTEVAGFPGEGRFEELVARSFERWRAAKGARGVELAVVHGPADVDDGGVALLGAYEPPQDGALVMPPVVRVYTRTFRAMFREEPYDVEREIDVTVRHELDHHLAYLSGDDPVDDEERDEVLRDELRTVGRKESLRRATRAARGDVGAFFGRTWPLWAALVIVAYALYAFTR